MSLYIQDLEESGLDFKDLSTYLTYHKKAPAYIKDSTLGALEFKYYNLDGETLPYSRFKIYWPPLTGFAAHAKDVRPKYIQPPDSLNHLYLPPVTNWREILEDQERTVALTEGEKKALALNLRGIPTAGLGGVNSIGNRKKGQPIIPELKELCAGGRPILIIFDVDQGFTAMKPQVAAAAQTLAQAILMAGGVPKIVTLPSDGTKKCAVDDWLKTHDLRDFGLYLELVKYALAHETADALYAEAKKYVYITDSNSLGKISNREAVLVQDYRISAGNQQVVVQELVIKRQKNGPPVATVDPVVRTLAEAFLKWPSRPQARSTNYIPGVAHYLTATGEFNQWKGWAQPTPTKVTNDDVAPLWAAFVALYGEHALQMWEWFMYPIAKPGAKLVMIPVIQAMQEGVGKSSIPSFFSKFVYGEGMGTPNNATTLNAMSLKDGRLEFMVNKQFLFLDDANDIHGNDVEALIKNLATTESVRANPKYVRSYDCKNYINLIITTNRTMPFKIPETDRRLFFPNVNIDVSKKTWHDLHRWGEAGGGGKVVAYAQQLFDAEAVDPYATAPMTNRKSQIVGIAKHPFEAFVGFLTQQAQEGGLRRVVFTGQELRALAAKDGAIRDTFDVHNHLLHRALEGAGVRVYRAGTPVRLGNGTARICVLGDIEKWSNAEPKDIAHEIEKVPLDNLYTRPEVLKEKVVPIKKAAKF